MLQSLISSSLSLRKDLEKLNAADSRCERIKSHIREQLQSELKCIGDFPPGLQWFNCGEPLSMGKQLQRKLVVLDFFTYCCVNCMHILPHLHNLEEKYPISTGLIVVGVHSAKFDNEKDSVNIAAALRRYGVTHPVVNDPDSLLWTDLGISCWPTLVIIGPQGNPLLVLVGENHINLLFEYVDVAMKEFKLNLSNHSILPAAADPVQTGLLLFPGKICTILLDRGLELLAISNSGLHTIIIATSDGSVKFVIGATGYSGFVDGDFRTARFKCPQGVAFRNSEHLFVADTGNHAIREVDLKEMVVRTISSSSTHPGLRKNTENEPSISSPWDLCIFRKPSTPPKQLVNTSSLDKSAEIIPGAPPCPPPIPVLSFAPPCPPPLPVSMPVLTNSVPFPLKPPPCPPPLPASNSVSLPPKALALPQDSSSTIPEPHCGTDEIVLIAMAGCHQIWGLFLQDTIWWKEKMYSAGSCVPLAGSGKEENRNSSYPWSAGFAQPSGLTCVQERNEVYIADSESSNIRCLHWNGKVTKVAGKGENPMDLFGHGDIDGHYGALSHPLGVTWDKKRNYLYVADSYNHKIKTIDIDRKLCKSFIGNKAGDSVGNLDSSQVNEPGGLCMSACCDKLYIADTNNHCIKVVDLVKSEVQKFELKKIPEEKTDGIIDHDISIPISSVAFGGCVKIFISIRLPEHYSFTKDAPHKWILQTPNPCWKSPCKTQNFNPEGKLVLTFYTPDQQNYSHTENDIFLKLSVYVCSEGICTVVNRSFKISVCCEKYGSKLVAKTLQLNANV